MAWPSTRTKTAAAGGTWTPDDMNDWQDAFLRDAGITADDLALTLAQKLGINQTASSSSGAVKTFRSWSQSTGEIVVTTATADTNLMSLSAQSTAGLALAFLRTDFKRTSGSGNPTIALIDSGNTQRALWTLPSAGTADYQTVTSETFLPFPYSTATALKMKWNPITGSVTFRNPEFWVITVGF